MKKPPRIVCSKLTGRIYVATSYKELGGTNGVIQATTKYDVTQEAIAAVVAHLKEYNVEQVEDNGERVRISIVEEPICAGDCNEGQGRCSQCVEREAA